MDQDGFTLVTRKVVKSKEKKENAKINYKKLDTRASRREKVGLENKIDEFRKQLMEWGLMDYVRNKLKDWINDNVNVVCLGSGSPSQLSIAQWQLAFASELIPEKIVQVYDPAMVEKDVEWLTGNWKMMNGLSDICGEKILYYMPHCDASLYELILGNHIQHHHVDGTKICMIGNSISNYKLRSTLTTLKDTPIMAKLENFQEIPLSNGPWDQVESGRVFNDTCIHFFIT